MKLVLLFTKSPGTTYVRPLAGSLPIRHLRRHNLSAQRLSALTPSNTSNLLPHTMQQTQPHRFSSLLKSSVLYAHKPNFTQKPPIQNHLSSILPKPLPESDSHGNTLSRSLASNHTLSSSRTMLHEGNCNYLAELLAQRKVCNQPRAMSIIRSPFLPTHSLSSTIIPCTNPSSPVYFASNHFEPPSSFTLQLPPLNLLPSHSNFHTSSAVGIPTASTHNCSSTPHHNFAPPQPRVINLHAHSVATVMHSFLYNISHTP